jgi:DNA primase
MKEDFEIIKQKIRIEDIAYHLLGENIRGMYKFPQERTASIKIYSKSQSFYDFGRGTGGDAIRLWSHVRQVDNWTALNEIKTLYGISDSPDKENIRQRIRQQEQANEVARKDQKRHAEAWRRQVDTCKRRINALDIIQQHSEPFSDAWCMAVNQKQMEEYRLDFLCSVR